MQDINYDRYKQEIVTVIDDYLKARTSAKHAAEWALKLVVARDFERLPKRMRYALYLILDLHDEGKPWCPTQEELKDCKRILLNEPGRLPSFVEGKLKSRSTHGARKEIKALYHKIVESSDKGNTEKPLP